MPKPRSPASTPTPRPTASTSAGPAALTCSGLMPSSTRTAAGRVFTSRPKAMPSYCSKTARSAGSGPRSAVPTAVPTWATSSRAKAYDVPTDQRAWCINSVSRAARWIPRGDDAQTDEPRPMITAKTPDEAAGADRQRGPVPAATAQTADMVRTAAISWRPGRGARSLWMGRTTLPGLASTQATTTTVPRRPASTWSPATRCSCSATLTQRRASPAEARARRLHLGTAARPGTARENPGRHRGGPWSSPAPPRKPSSSTSTRSDPTPSRIIGIRSAAGTAPPGSGRPGWRIRTAAS